MKWTIVINAAALIMCAFFTFECANMTYAQPAHSMPEFVWAFASFASLGALVVFGIVLVYKLVSLID